MPSKGPTKGATVLADAKGATSNRWRKHIMDLYIYSGLLAIGGTIGYLKAGSVASLVMGLASSALVYGGIYYKKRGNPIPLAVSMQDLILDRLWNAAIADGEKI